MRVIGGKVQNIDNFLAFFWESGLTCFGCPGILNLATSGSSSVVEHRLAKARVASSNLVSRSIPPSGPGRVGYGGMERDL